MSECNKQRLSDKALELISAAVKNGQDLKLNSLQITTDAKDKDGNPIFENGARARNAFAQLFSDSKEAIDEAIDILEEIFFTGDEEAGEPGRIDVKAKTGLIFRNGDDKGALGILNRNEDKDVDTLVEDSIAMQIVLDSIQSEIDTQAGSDVSASKLDEINATGIPTSMLRLAPTIGRSIAKARGKVLNGDIASNHANYSKMGMKILERLIAEDLLVRDDNAQIVVGAVKTVAGNSKSGVFQTPAIRVNEKTFKDYIPASTDEKKTPSELLAVLKQLSRLTNPYTELAPKNEAADSVFTAHEKFQVESTIDTIKKVQAGAMRISPSVQVFMDHLHKMYIDADGERAFETTLKQEFGVDDEFEFLEQVFGITVPKGDFTDRSEIGKKVSRVGPLVGLMQNYSTMDINKFFFTYNQAQNSRFFQRESILNVQSDKKMARNVIESTYEFEYSEDEIDELVARVGIEFGLPKEVVAGDDKSNLLLEDLLKWYDEGTPEAHRNIMIQVSNKKNKTGMDTNNPWVIHKALGAISDIRKGLASEDGVVKSSMLIESDASGSGPVLKLLQNMHKDRAIDILKRLGLIKVSDEELEKLGGKLVDFYQLAQERFAVLEKEVENQKAGMYSDMDLSLETTLNQVKAIMTITGNEGDFRSFIKDPIIRFTYEQSPTENIKETAKLLAETIVLKGPKAINETIDALNIKDNPNKKKASDPNKPHYNEKEDLTLEQQEDALLFISRALQLNVTSFMVKDVLVKTYSDKLFDGTKTTINKVFEIIQKKIGASEKDGGITFKFMEPSVVLDWLDNNPGKTVEDFPYAENKKYRLIGDKRYETRIGHGTEATLMPLWHANETSAHILPIHAMDAAILIRALAKVYDKVNKVPGLEKITPEDLSILMVHDATILPPKISKLVEEAYEHEIINASMHYDVVYMMLKEAAYKASLKEYEAALKKGIKDAKFKEMSIEEFAQKYPSKELDKIIKENKENRAKKIAMLNVTPDGKTRVDEKGRPNPNSSDPINVIPNSFATNLDETEFTKVRDENVIGSKDGVNAGYKKRKGADKKPKKVKAAPTPDKGKDIPVAPLATSEEIQEVVDIFLDETFDYKEAVPPVVTAEQIVDEYLFDMEPTEKRDIIANLDKPGMREALHELKIQMDKCKGK